MPRRSGSTQPHEDDMSRSQAKNLVQGLRDAEDVPVPDSDERRGPSLPSTVTKSGSKGISSLGSKQMSLGTSGASLSSSSTAVASGQPNPEATRDDRISDEDPLQGIFGEVERRNRDFERMRQERRRQLLGSAARSGHGPPGPVPQATAAGSSASEEIQGPAQDGTNSVSDQSGSDDEFDMFSADDEDVAREAKEAAEAAAAAKAAGGEQKQGLRVDELSDAEGYLVARVGTLLGSDSRYEVQGELGRGVFSSVFMCIDRQSAAELGIGGGGDAGELPNAADGSSVPPIVPKPDGMGLGLGSASGTGVAGGAQASTEAVEAGGPSAAPAGTQDWNGFIERWGPAAVAVKVLRDNDRMRLEGQRELAALKTVKEADRKDRHFLVRLRESFKHGQHLCICFEAMGGSLKEAQDKFGRTVGIALDAVRQYAVHLFRALALLHKVGFVHADLKPQNVLVAADYSHCRLGDLGSAFRVEAAEPTAYLVTPYYRAPEIMLGLPHTTAIDVWSLGCVLFEAFTGELAFTGRDNNEMLLRFQQALGPFPLRIARSHVLACRRAADAALEAGAVPVSDADPSDVSAGTVQVVGDMASGLSTGGLKCHFSEDGSHFLHRDTDPASMRACVRSLRLVRPVPEETIQRRVQRKAGPRDSRASVQQLVDLLLRCFTLDPRRRITAAEALQHPFLHPPVAVPEGGELVDRDGGQADGSYQEGGAGAHVGGGSSLRG